MPTNVLDEEVIQKLIAPGQMLEIVEETIRGVPLRVYKNTPNSLRDVFQLSKGHGSNDFLVYEDERWQFDRHYRAVATVSRWLVEECGIRKGDRVAIAMRNFPEWSVAFWAATCAGAIVVPLNAWWTGEELKYGLSDSGTRVLFCDLDRFQRIEPHISDLPLLSRVVIAKCDPPPRTDGFDDLMVAQTDVLPDVELGPEDECTIFYTSGTTGFPKGALGTHRNICTNLMNLMYAGLSGRARAGLDPSAPPPQAANRSAQLLSVPFFHVTGCHSTLVPNLAFGGKLVLMYRWNPERALELIEREKITSFGGVPTMVWQVLESPDFDKRDTSSVVSIGYGGAPAPTELVRRIEQHFPKAAPGNGYGLTETSSLAVGNGGADYLRKPESCGRPAPVVDAMVVGEKGEELGTEELGELWLRGPNVVKGYWNKPEATNETFHEGWLKTGDVARIDDEGFIYIVDRAKDMVIRGGENVYCVEIEDVLYEHPAVSEAAVIGIPHRVLGEEVGAVVKRVPGAEVTEDELKDFVAQRLAAYKVPVRIDVSDEPLPRNAAGKVLKRQLKDKIVASA